MKNLRSVAGWTLIALALGGSTPAPMDNLHPVCVTQADTVRPHLERLQWIVANTSSAILADAHLPSQPPEGVTVVADDSLCAQAVAAFNSRLTGSDTVFAATRLIVLRAGTSRYVVSRPTSPTTPGWRFSTVLDAAFQFLGVLGGP